MKILAIETSCDDTALSLVEAEGGLEEPRFKVLAHLVSSQTKIHEEWGGVVPMLAKREHGKNLVPLLLKLLKETNLSGAEPYAGSNKEEIEKILEREPELKENFFQYVINLRAPEIDAIVVTYGPGLEPALWVGLNFARALSLLWHKPLIPVNHMEGHIYASLAATDQIIEFPALALLVSGGHTELVLVKNWLEYQILGQTRDDAVGEAFDKVARILGLPYPGGPEISRLAKTGEKKKEFTLPRPMIHSDNYDFSFSGLKTAVLYMVKKIPELTEEIKASIAREFEDSVVEVLTTKTHRALDEFSPATVIIGGGVSANNALRTSLEKLLSAYPDKKLLLPDRQLSTDNATMIAIAGYLHYLSSPQITPEPLRALGNLSL